MQRLTAQTAAGYAAQDSAAAIARLGQVEDMIDAAATELAKVTADMQDLKACGREKSATFRQLFANKLTLQVFFSRVEVYVK